MTSQDEHDCIGVGLIGTGYMGKCHALAFGAVHAVFGDVPRPQLELLCDVEADVAKTKAAEFGFSRWTTDWREVVTDDRVDVVSITSPNAFHKDMAIAAMDAGKAVYCEKPLALTLEDAEAMANAAHQTGAKSLVGYNYIRNPVVIHAKRLIDQGAIGRVLQFRGACDEDYMADENIPYTWRCRIEVAGTGTLGDLAVHLTSVARFLVGDIAEVSGDVQTVHANRPDPDNPGKTGNVENDDQANALVRFANGVQGLLCSSRVAWGRKSHLSWEIHGSKGMLRFDQERMNELHLYQLDGEVGQQGFKTILTGPAHPPYGLFVPAPGHQLGFNDLKVIEVAHLLRGMTGQEELSPTIEDALHMERVVHAIILSSQTGQWVKTGT